MNHFPYEDHHEKSSASLDQASVEEIHRKVSHDQRGVYQDDLVDIKSRLNTFHIFSEDLGKIHSSFNRSSLQSSSF